MKIVVGSTNPVKVAAAKAVFGQLVPDVQVLSVAAELSVPNQPWGDEQTQAGAINRARELLMAGTDYGVGFEGGVIELPYGLMTCAWCAVVDASGAVGLGGGVNCLLPPSVADAVRAGKELGPAMDALTGDKDTKEGPGAVGILTNGLIDRQQAYEQILAMALARFMTPDYYAEENPT